MRLTREQRAALVWLKRHGGIVCTNTPDFPTYDALTQCINRGYVSFCFAKQGWFVFGMRRGFHALTLTRRGWQIAHRG